MATEKSAGGAALSECIFIGQVSAYGKAPGTVIVRRPDKDDRTSAELAVMSRCTKETKDYWMPAIDEQVLCIGGARYARPGDPVQGRQLHREQQRRDGNSCVEIAQDYGAAH